MIEITPKQLFGHLEKYGTAVHCEMYGNYVKWYSGDDISVKLFYHSGCTVVVDNYEFDGKYHIRRSIHQTTPDADIDAVTAYWQNEAADAAKNCENPEITILAFTVSNGELPPEKDKFYGWRNYIRKGEKYDADERVRELTVKDSDIIRAACESSMENDNVFGKQLAESFINHINHGFNQFNEKTRIYGIFDGKSLAGMAVLKHEEPLGLAWLSQILVAQSYRRKDFGKDLVLTILSDYPNIKWHYQAEKQNADSIAFAKSLGFQLEGACLFIR